MEPIKTQHLMYYKILLLVLFSIFFSCKSEVEPPYVPPAEPEVHELNKLIITTENAVNITSKEDYIEGVIEVLSNNPEENLMEEIKIRGRGNSTWTFFPKKSYQIKFEDKEDFLGMPEDRRWILLANYSDKTFLRNEIGFELGKMSNLDWTPDSRFIDLYLNEEYIGIYQVTQKIEETSNRVDIGNDGFLLEVDQLSRLNADDVYFETDNYLFNIKEPNVDFDDNEYNSIKNFMYEFEAALLGPNFLNPNNGYRKYLDTEAMIDWYIINELTRNNDASFHTSVFMHLSPGSKLKMGPIWDFDISLGNIDYNGNEKTDGFWIKEKALWITRLFEDPDFVAAVKSRFNYFYTNRMELYDKIDDHYANLAEPQVENFKKWPILGEYIWPNYMYFDTYDEEVDYLRKWLDMRFEWLKVAIDDL